MVEGHIIPRYEVLRQSTSALAMRARDFCNTPSPSLLSWLDATFRQTQLAWAGVEHTAIGPVEEERRRWRIHLWPDKRGTAAKQLRLLLAEADMAALTPDAFAAGSVGVQGLPALERLLYPMQAPGEPRDAAAVVAALAPGGAAGYRCALIVAIADNLATMSREIAAGWTTRAPAYRDLVRSAGPESPVFSSAQQVSSLLLRDLVTGLERLTSQRLQRPLGDSIEGAWPIRAEAWRSGNSLLMARAALVSLRHQYQTGLSPLLMSDARRVGLAVGIERHLDAAVAALDSVRMPLARAVSEPAARGALESAQTHLKAAQEALEARVSEALKLPVGFNSLDGD